MQQEREARQQDARARLALLEQLQEEARARLSLQEQLQQEASARLSLQEQVQEEARGRLVDRQDHYQQVVQRGDEHQAQLGQERERYEAQMVQRDEEHRAQLHQEHERYEAQMVRCDEEHQAHLHQVRERYKAEMSQSDEEHQAQLRQERERYEAQLQAFREQVAKPAEDTSPATAGAAEGASSGGAGAAATKPAEGASPAAADAAEGASPAAADAAGAAGYAAWSMQQLRSKVQACGINKAGCVERQDLVSSLERYDMFMQQGLEELKASCIQHGIELDRLREWTVERCASFLANPIAPKTTTVQTKLHATPTSSGIFSQCQRIMSLQRNWYTSDISWACDVLGLPQQTNEVARFRAREE